MDRNSFTRKYRIVRCMNKRENSVQTPKHSVLLFFLVTVMAACSPVREITVPDIEDLTVSSTLHALRTEEASFDFFSTRFSGVVTVDNSSYNASGTIRIRRDSAIYISVSPFLGIEAARVLITPDDVQIINRLDGTYFKGGMAYVNSMLNTQLDFYMLQALLLGNDFAHFSSENFTLSADGERILLRNPGRFSDAGGVSGSLFQQNLWLDHETFRILENLIYEPLTRRSLRARYERFDKVSDQTVPTAMTWTIIDPASRTELSLRYSRTTINEPQPIRFSVPDRYEHIGNGE